MLTIIIYLFSMVLSLFGLGVTAGLPIIKALSTAINIGNIVLCIIGLITVMWRNR